MTKTNSKLILPAEEVGGTYLSLLLNNLEIKNYISEEDGNLVFVDYEGFNFDSEDSEYIKPLLSIYFDHESKFARFTLLNAAPKKITKKTIGQLIKALNENHVLTNYESTESDGNFYISGEYWLNYKFGFNTLVAHHLIHMLPAIFSGALSTELSNIQ